VVEGAETVRGAEVLTIPDLDLVEGEKEAEAAS
jgi:hypothetical protein